MAALVVVAGATAVFAAVDKQQSHDEMGSIAAEMRALKPAVGQPGNAAAYAALEARYRELSAQLGGDDPAAVLPGRPVDGRVEGGPGGPPPPPNCVVTENTATQATPTPIPTGPAVVSSTLVVAGAGPWLWDLDLSTTLTHTFAADLDITLMSPAGTVVTLTTDNGAGNDNTFNGTLWDDDANPGGQVPYTTNAGMATDHPYVNLTTATPLVPEESFGAFIGEDPNGTWTITISDDLAGDGGSLASWTLTVRTFPAAPQIANTMATQATPTAIPTGPAVVTSTLVVAGAGTSILDVDLTTFLTHTFAADLDITLMSPAGTVVTLTTDNGAGNDNVFNGTVWDDDADPDGQVPYVTNANLTTDHPYVNLTLASPLAPEEAMAAFAGEDPNGTWTITISDDLAGDGGSLDSWTLDIDTATCLGPCVLTCPADITDPNDPGQCGAVVNYPAPGTMGGCTVVTCVPPSGSFFPVGTTPIACTDASQTSCNFNVTVGDVESPMITCPADVESDDPVVIFPPPMTSDNCPGVGAACVPPSGSTFPPGDTTDSCTATDASGNTAACTFTVTIGGSILEIPTLDVWGLAALALVLAALGLWLVRRRVAQG
jgi:subtilisin-like proprotein convertase family protein